MKPLVVVVGAVGIGAIGFLLWRHQRQGTVAAMKAPFIHPIFPYPLKSRHVSSPFNEQRKTGPHSGIDLKTLFEPMTENGVTFPNPRRPDPNGVPGIGMELRAPFDGVVRMVDDNPSGSGGKELIFSAADGTRVGWSHLHTLFVKAGDTFAAGDVLALSGDTGGVTGPHLHMTVRDRDGVLVDPAPYLGL